ncbi:hypothetical protein ZWY2020_016159 [Hordeum vulgare]|nr:hypothetical protein ZWY2020_016159 [Hordeum vulgare]
MAFLLPKLTTLPSPLKPSYRLIHGRRKLHCSKAAHLNLRSSSASEEEAPHQVRRGETGAAAVAAGPAKRKAPPFPSLPSPQSSPPPPPPAAAPMGYVLSAVARVLEQPTAWGAACEMALLAGPLWAAALVGLLLGWAWRPRWAAGIVAPADPPQLASLDF